MSAVENPSARAQVFEPLRHARAAEAIVRRIGEAIGSGVLEPGERLPSETDLARMLGVAPMTLRQAIGALREAGFITTQRGRTGGTFVAPDARAALMPAARLPTATGWRELTTWRRAISGEAASEAARRAGPAERAALAELAAAVDAATGDFPSFRRSDSRLHVALAEIAGNRRLIAAETAIQAELADILAAVPAPAVAARLSSAGHGPILAAVAASKPANARAAMEIHVESTYDWIAGFRLGLR
jgi:GntR family transcriptional repressor for pyruvate dehydrogenase complex